MKRVFICSRYAGHIEANVRNAERLCRRAVEQGCAPFAPHLLFTRFLNDAAPEERNSGIECGLAFMEMCDEVWAYTGNGVSDGMRREIAHARDLGKPVIELTEV